MQSNLQANLEAFLQDAGQQGVDPSIATLTLAISMVEQLHVRLTRILGRNATEEIMEGALAAARARVKPREESAAPRIRVME